jgi:putative transposase
LPEKLERVRSSTNLIKNLFGRVRAIGRRVKRWPNGTMVLRWTAAGVLEAARGFRKLRRLSCDADRGRRTARPRSAVQS